jgi:hypothetical protein
MTFMLSKAMVFTALITILSGVLLPHSAIASTSPRQQSSILILTRANYTSENYRGTYLSRIL